MQAILQVLELEGSGDEQRHVNLLVAFPDNALAPPVEFFEVLLVVLFVPAFLGDLVALLDEVAELDGLAIDAVDLDLAIALVQLQLSVWVEAAAALAGRGLLPEPVVQLIVLNVCLFLLPLQRLGLVLDGLPRLGLCRLEHLL